MRSWIWFLAGVVAAPLVLGAVAFGLFRTSAKGFSARDEPMPAERFAAELARGMALPADARTRPNPIPVSAEILKEGRAHWADHCASCHANDGSGDTPLGRQMYPHSPDMRKDATQRKTDGELFYMIENGIRLSGMPAWGGSAHTQQDSWKLVHFIRHLPALSDDEMKEMEQLNPKSPDDLEEERQEADFLRGGSPGPAAQGHHHDH